MGGNGKGGTEKVSAEEKGARLFDWPDGLDE